MAAKKLKPKTEEEFYIQVLDACTYEIARININIELYSFLDPETVVGDKNLGQGLGMQASEKCTAAEAVEINKQNLKVYTDKRDAILRLLNK